MKTAAFWITKLGLVPHPEGGYFRETYRSEQIIPGETLNPKYPGNRNLATSIFFLLSSNQVSKLHRLKSDEIWYFHYGASLVVHVFHNGSYQKYTMGAYTEEEQLQLIIPAGAIFGAEVSNQDPFSLVGCMVTPGFHFDDFELIKRADAMSLYPTYNDVISRLT